MMPHAKHQLAGPAPQRLHQNFIKLIFHNSIFFILHTLKLEFFVPFLDESYEICIPIRDFKYYAKVIFFFIEALPEDHFILSILRRFFFKLRYSRILWRDFSIYTQLKGANKKNDVIFR